MFVSILVVLYPVASTGPCVPGLDIDCCNLELRPAITSHLPSRVSLLVSADILQEGETVYLLTSEVLKVLCVCHVRIMLIVLPAPALRLRRGFGRCLPYMRQQCCCLPSCITENPRCLPRADDQSYPHPHP